MSRAGKSHSLFVSIVAAALLLTLPVGAAATRSSAKEHTGTIAFLRDGQGLNVIRADGTGLTRLTPPGMSVWSYAWSPNGRSIAFIDGEQNSLWLVRPDGTGLRRLISGSSLASDDLSWSPDGKNIAITSLGPYTKAKAAESCDGMRIYIFSVHGLYARKLRGTAASCDGVAWSPRGNEIAFGNGGIWIVRPDGSGRRQLTFSGWGWLRWSPSGKQIAFGLRVRQGLYRGIGVVGADGRHFHVVTRNAYNEYPAAWSPSGRWILYGRANGGGTYLISANGRNDIRVTSDSPPGTLFGALAWSPDGDSIVYATPTGSGANLYEVGVNGRGKLQLTNSPSSDRDPSWVAR
jgi:Tol biopolymer transport system component